MKLCWILPLFFLAACSNQNSFETIEWKNGDSIRDLHFLNEIQSSVPTTFQILDEKIEYSQQTFAGIEIENTFVKRINEQYGELQAVAATYKKRTDGYEKLPLQNFKVTPDLKSKIRARFPYLTSQEINSVAPVIEPDSKIVWRLTYFTHDGTPHLLKLDENLKLVSDRIVGMNWFDQKVLLFPAGPKFSDLKEITFYDVSFSPPLSNAIYEITSTVSTAFAQNPLPLKFAPNDPRLDQLQAYFYVEQTLAWIRSTLGVQVPLHLDVQLHVGHPEKTNAAFYYDGKIRLGQGDDIVYSKIPQDPTIVAHEVFHALIDAVAHLPTQGQGGSLNEAYADYFASQLLGKPYLGDTAYLQGPFKRSLDIDKKWSDKTGGLYGDSLIISSLLWNLSKNLPSDKIRKASLKTLAHLNPNSDFAHFNSELVISLKEFLTADELVKANEILRARGFSL